MIDKNKNNNQVVLYNPANNTTLMEQYRIDTLAKIEHHKQFKPVLDELAKGQSKVDHSLLNSNLSDVVIKVHTDCTSKRDLISFVDVTVVKKKSFENIAEFKTFFRDTKESVSRLEIQGKPNLLTKFQEETVVRHHITDRVACEFMRDRGYNSTQKFDEDHQHFKEALNGFVKSIHPEQKSILNDIISYIAINEYLTSFALDDRIAISVGFKVFIHIYGVLKQPGNLEYFIYATRSQMFYNNINIQLENTFDTLKKYKLPIFIVGVMFTVGLLSSSKESISEATEVLMEKAAPYKIADRTEKHLAALDPETQEAYRNISKKSESYVYLSINYLQGIKRAIFEALWLKNIDYGLENIEKIGKDAVGVSKEIGKDINKK